MIYSDDLFCRRFRILLDRAHADLDSICQSLDSDPEPEPLASPLLTSPLRNSNASTSETNTSDPTSSSHLPSSPSPPSSSSSPTPVDLSRILLNIKTCRWRHFRPRTLSHHPLGGGDLSRRGFRDLSRTVSGLSRTLSGGASTQNRTGPAPTPVNGEWLVSSAALLAVFFLYVSSGFVVLSDITVHVCPRGPFTWFCLTVSDWSVVVDASTLLRCLLVVLRCDC